MRLREKLELAELYHEMAQNAIVEALKSYLLNGSRLFQYGRPSKEKRRKVSDLTHDVQWVAEKTETHLELISRLHISNLQNDDPAEN